MSTAGSSPFLAARPRRVPSTVWIALAGTGVMVFVCCGLPCLLGSFMAHRDTAAQKEAAPFESHLAEYVHLAVQAETQTPSGALRGKLIPVSREPIAVDSALWFELPADLRAANPQELAAVVLVERYLSNVGYYSKGRGKAHEFGVKIRVVDYPSGKLIAAETFHGSTVPREFDHEQHIDVYGKSVDDRKIVEFLRKLRQQ
jgi:hypothetical protein